MCSYHGGHLLLSSAHLLQERNKGHETIVILWFTEILHESFSFIFSKLLPKVGKESEELVANHGIVVILVVELQDLNEVVEASLVLGVLAGLVHGEDIGLGQELLSLGDSTTDLLDGLQGWVEVAGTDEVANIEGINLAISLEVIDVKGEVDGWKASELGRWWCVGRHSGGGKGGAGVRREVSTCLATGGCG